MLSTGISRVLLLCVKRRRKKQLTKGRKFTLSEILSFPIDCPHSWSLIDSRIICTHTHKHTERQTHIHTTIWVNLERASTSKDVNNLLLGIIHGHQSMRMCALYRFFILPYTCVRANVAVSFCVCGSSVNELASIWYFIHRTNHEWCPWLKHT